MRVTPEIRTRQQRVYVILDAANPPLHTPMLKIMRQRVAKDSATDVILGSNE
jgi:hypothetical protein